MKVDVNTIILIAILLVLLFKKNDIVIEQPIYEEVTQIKKKQNEINNFKFDDSIYFTNRDSLRAIRLPK